MAIRTEDFGTRTDGVRMIRTYSDAGKYIIQSGTGIQYAEAVDVEGSGNTYTESAVDRPALPTPPAGGEA